MPVWRIEIAHSMYLTFDVLLGPFFMQMLSGHNVSRFEAYSALDISALAAPSMV